MCCYYKLHDWIDIDNIDWKLLSYNESGGAIQLLKQTPDKINWSNLNWNINSNVIDLLRLHQEKICWTRLSINPKIFTYDYERMRQSNSKLREELMKVMFSPENIDKFNGWGF